MNQIPDDILNIIFSYKVQIDLIDVNKQYHDSKSTCMNCDESKNCLFECYKCSKPVCAGCRYADLNDFYIDENHFEIYYKCDKCDLLEYSFEVREDSDSEYEDYVII